MLDFLQAHFRLEHLLCFLILVSRIGDIGSTYLVTPNLLLEANPIMRKLGWPFAFVTLLVCLIPYYSVEMGVVILVPSLLVSSSNAAKIWFVRAYGEREYRDLIVRLVRTSKLSHALGATLGSAFFVGLAGGVLLLLSPDPEKGCGYWFAMGILCYAFVVAFYGSLSFIQLFRSVRRSDKALLAVVNGSESSTHGGTP